MSPIVSPPPPTRIPHSSHAGYSSHSYLMFILHSSHASHSSHSSLMFIIHHSALKAIHPIDPKQLFTPLT